ncbi:ATP-binding cassette domain-containing protein [bacterium]|nr:ATP-binding cassette domain-containing protein [bacterium]MBU3955761.1 ATP-binding cassette domain-containing protein [bacterium]
MYRLKNLRKSYDAKPVLNISSLNIEEGGFFVVYGPNGSGKTTLLNIMAFLDIPDEGDVILGGGKYNRRDVTMVMQDPYYFRTTVGKNVAMGLIFRSVEKNRIEEIIQPVMEDLGIWEFRNRDIRTLSAGEKKRAAIARAMVLDTRVLLFDEITANIDRMNSDIIEGAVLNLVRHSGKTVIMTTHDLNQAYRLTLPGNILFLANGSFNDTPLWNVFRVNLSGGEDVKKVRLSDGAEISVATDRTGTASICINPKSIIVAKKRFDSSALNSLKGKVVGIADRHGAVDLVVDAGVKLHVLITCKSFKEMNLEIGTEVFAVFKATEIEVI